MAGSFLSPFLDPTKMGNATIAPIPGQPQGAGNPIPNPAQSPFSGGSTIGSPWNPNPSQYSSNPATAAPSPFSITGQTPAGPGMPPPIAGLANDPTSSAFYKQLYGDATQPLNVSPNDPIIQGETEAYNAQATGAAKDLLSQAAANGGQFYNPGATTASVAENLGKSTAGFQAQAMADERNARRTAAQQALATQGSFLSSQQQQALQEEIARLNLEEQAYEFGQNQDYLYSPFASGARA